MFTEEGLKAEAHKEEPANDLTDFAPTQEELPPAKVVSLRSVEIPELIQNLNGFQNLQFIQASDGPQEDGPQIAQHEDFSAIALQLRTSIGEFLASAIETKQYIGLQNVQSAEQREEKEAAALVKDLEALELDIEKRLILPPEDPFLEEVLPAIHEHLGEVMRTVRAAWDGENIRPDLSEMLAYQLLEFRALITSTALELDARNIGEQLQSGLQIQKTGPEGDARILTIDDNNAMMQEILRQKVLQTQVLPEIQQVTSEVVNTLIPFIVDLRKREPAPFGFAFNGVEQRDPLTVDTLVETLESGITALDEHFESLDTPSPTDVNYRAYIHGIGHHLSALRIALLRQHAEGSINQQDVQMVQAQCEDVLRKVTATVKQLAEVANADLQTMIVGDPDKAA